MSTETNKATVRRQIEQLWNKGRVDLVEEFFTEDTVSHKSVFRRVPGWKS